MTNVQKYTCIVIDDEPHAIVGLQKYIELVPNLTLLKTYENPMQALLELADSEQVDLILMDIDMPQITGIELSRQLREKTRRLVFTTAHTQYGYEAFEVSADAYLLKPYSLGKFAATMTRLFPTPPIGIAGQAGDYFFVKNKEDQHKLVRVNYRDVIAVESKQNYVMIHSAGQNILAYMSLSETAQLLAPFPDFVKYNRSFIINKEHIASISGNTLRMVNGLQVTVGDLFRKDFQEYLDQKLLKAGRRT